MIGRLPRRLSCYRHARAFLWSAIAIVFCAKGVSAQSAPPKLRLSAGQTIRYLVSGRYEKSVKTESRVSSILVPRVEKFDFAANLLVRVVTIEPDSFTAVVEFSPALSNSQAPPQQSNPTVTFTMVSDGRLTRAEGLDALEPAEQLAWEFWIARFGFASTIPPGKAKPGERWKSEEAVAGAPIAELFWERSTTNGPPTACPTKTNETCAVFLTTATLRQKGSLTDTTPPDYREKGLRTIGMAQGANEIYTSVSSATGMVMRASEDAKQTMDISVLKADGSNGLHYAVNATSHLELLFTANP